MGVGGGWVCRLSAMAAACEGTQGGSKSNIKVVEGRVQGLGQVSMLERRELGIA